MQKIKFIFFPIWNVEKIEKELYKEEENGCLIRSVKFNYWFSFSEKKNSNSTSNYFLTYKSFRGESMGTTDYALSSSHSANEVKTDNCYYSLYRTKSNEEELRFIRECRTDYLKVILRNRIFITLFFLFCFSGNLVLSFFSDELRAYSLILSVPAVISALILAIWIYGYKVQKRKCKIIEKI
ncbi:MAG: hypothetical protein MJ210_02470 [Alphaproteobacteria bacterium]|nr:hypothetical protein [Alphaproteobacteria bacterium]